MRSIGKLNTHTKQAVNGSNAHSNTTQCTYSYQQSSPPLTIMLGLDLVGGRVRCMRPSATVPQQNLCTFFVEPRAALPRQDARVQARRLDQSHARELKVMLLATMYRNARVKGGVGGVRGANQKQIKDGQRDVL
jgi:hypothetical protein